MRNLDPIEVECISGAFYEQLNRLYEDLKEGIHAFWSGAKLGYGLE
jgi:hypothetical protein